MKTTYIDFCVLQSRSSGDDYEVTTWATEEIARQEARQFLSQFTDESFDTLEELQEYCEDWDIAYVEISFHRLPLYVEA